MNKLLQILFLFFALDASATSLKGSLVDKITGEPLVGATIYLKGTSYGTAAGLDGSFRIKDVPSGNYVMVISLVGYTTIEKELAVIDGIDQSFAFSLEENANELSEIIIRGVADQESDLSVRRVEQKSEIVMNALSAKAIFFNVCQAFQSLEIAVAMDNTQL